MRLKDLRLVLLTTHFGNNFSGGSLASHEVLTRLQDHFGQVVVVGTQLGTHSIRNLKFLEYHHWLEAAGIIRKLQREPCLFYGDFYNAVLLAWLRVDFVFTYHDNWPELGKLNGQHALHGLFYSAAYRRIFKRSTRLVTVSEFKQTALRRFHAAPVLIKNGFRKPAVRPARTDSRVLMIGNIDARKYQLALSVFDQLAPEEEIAIDIYGHVIDRRLAARLKQYPFVQLKGFQHPIPFEQYGLLLHTSFTESFGMVFCEAISVGVPVLAFDAWGARELIHEGNGRLISAYDVSAMARTLVAMHKKPGHADPSSVDGLSWDKTAAQYLKLFRDVA